MGIKRGFDRISLIVALICLAPGFLLGFKYEEDKTIKWEKTAYFNPTEFEDLGPITPAPQRPAEKGRVKPTYSLEELKAERARRKKAGPWIEEDDPYADKLIIRNSKTGEEKLWDWEKKTWLDRKGAWAYFPTNFKSIKWPSELEDIRRANLPPPPKGYQGPFDTGDSYYFSPPISHYWIAGIISSIATFLLVLFSLTGLIRLIGWIAAGFKDN